MPLPTIASKTISPPESNVKASFVLYSCFVNVASPSLNLLTDKSLIDVFSNFLNSSSLFATYHCPFDFAQRYVPLPLIVDKTISPSLPNSFEGRLDNIFVFESLLYNSFYII